MTLGLLDDCDGVFSKAGKVGDAVVNVGGFVDSDQRLVKDREEITEKL